MVFRLKKVKKTKKRDIGDTGEDVACKFLKKRQFCILGRNYWKKWGEIDIIAQKGKNLHFVEVKSVTRENTHSNVSYEKNYRPEENVDQRKFARLNRAIQSYLEEKKVSESLDWQIDVITVILNMDTRRAKVEIIENIIMD